MEGTSQITAGFEGAGIEPVLTEESALEQWKLFVGEYLLVDGGSREAFEPFKRALVTAIMAGRIEIAEEAAGVVVKQKVKWPKGVDKVLSYAAPAAATLAKFHSANKECAPQEKWLKHAKLCVGEKNATILDGLGQGDRRLMEVVSQLFLSV